MGKMYDEIEKYLSTASKEQIQKDYEELKEDVFPKADVYRR